MLDQDFQADGPDQKWVTDITYLSTDAGWVYLAVVVDLFSRKVVGWAIGTSLATDLVAQALRQAIESRRPGPGLIHHLRHQFPAVNQTSWHYRRSVVPAVAVVTMNPWAISRSNP